MACFVFFFTFTIMCYNHLSVRFGEPLGIIDVHFFKETKEDSTNLRPLCCMNSLSHLPEVKFFVRVTKGFIIL